MDRTHNRRLFSLLCWLQGTYYLVTGAWPLVSMRSFKWVTGEKTDNLPSGLDFDHWLVATVAGLILAVAAALLIAAARKSYVLEVGVVALAAAVALTLIDVVYTARGVIAPIYLADAVVELPLIAGWTAVLITMLRTRSAANKRPADYVRIQAGAFETSR